MILPLHISQFSHHVGNQQSACHVSLAHAEHPAAALINTVNGGLLPV